MMLSMPARMPFARAGRQSVWGLLAISMSALCPMKCLAASGPYLTVSPPCSVPGGTLVIKGSGWPCDKGGYLFRLDGVPLDSIDCGGAGFFQVPLLAPDSIGGHIIRVEARLPEDFEYRIINCREEQFQVVGNLGDPWANAFEIQRDSLFGDKMIIRFDPFDACDIPLCDEIRLIQVVRFTGVRFDSTRVLRPIEIRHRFSPEIDSSVADSGWVVDVDYNRTNKPYYEGTPGFLKQTANGRTGLVATLGDRPRVVREAFPLDIPEIVMDFQVYAFCERGDGRGRWLGSATWTWDRIRGYIGGEISEGSTSRESPDSTSLFMRALKRFNGLHGFSLPDTTQTAPTKGGQPCN